MVASIPNIGSLQLDFILRIALDSSAIRWVIWRENRMVSSSTSNPVSSSALISADVIGGVRLRK